MASLYFPQMTSGALVQYPIRKTQSVRTVQNVLPDGSELLYADATGSMITWQLAYQELSITDIQSLQMLYASCCGPLRAFTFIDPTENMLAWSSDLTNPVWNVGPSLQVLQNIADPIGGSNAFTIINNGQTAQGIMQRIAVPANYQYCFSLNVHSIQGATVSLTRGGTTASSTDNFVAAAVWKRIVSTGQLNDGGTFLIVSVTLPPGAQAEVYGLQLDAQVSPSDYRPTASRSGIYTNAHWASDHFPVVATALDQYATTFLIESSL